jgi:hypothetical protein
MLYLAPKTSHSFLANRETFGQRLKRLRLQSGLSIGEAAEAIGVSPSTYREPDLPAEMMAEDIKNWKKWFVAAAKRER